MPLLRHQPSESQALTSVSHKLSAEGHEGGKGGGGVLHILVLLPGHLAAIAVNVEGEAHADRQLGRLARETSIAFCVSTRTVVLVKQVR
jgi:hypothetical protein